MGIEGNGMKNSFFFLFPTNLLNYVVHLSAFNLNQTTHFISSLLCDINKSKET